MAEVDFLALIEQGSESWNLWRANNPDIQPDLSQAYLFGQVLGEYDFSNTNFERACLIGTNLRGANLRGSFLQSVYASNADFTGADLTQADLSRGNFSEARFDEANLLATQAIGSNFSGASFSGASLLDWNINQTTVLNDLRGSYLYLNEQRQPPTGEFAPGEMKALLQPSAVKFKTRSSSPEKSGQKTRDDVKDKLKDKSRLLLMGGLGTAMVVALTSLHLSTRPTNSTPSAQEPQISPPVLTDEFIALPCNEAQVPAQLIANIGHVYKDGTRFYGTFIDGQPADGRGTLIYPSNNRYDGEFKAGQRSGCGTFTFSNGRRYIGQFEADQFNGKGTWILENGERYIGEFKNNKCEGKGTFIFANGSSKSGIWKDGKLLDSSISCDLGTLAQPSFAQSESS